MPSPSTTRRPDVRLATISLLRRSDASARAFIARSPVMLTPFSGDWNIEAAPLAALIDSSFEAAGLTRDDIDTGAVIITGTQQEFWEYTLDEQDRVIDCRQVGSGAVGTTGPQTPRAGLVMVRPRRRFRRKRRL